MMKRILGLVVLASSQLFVLSQAHALTIDFESAPDECYLNPPTGPGFITQGFEFSFEVDQLGWCLIDGNDDISRSLLIGGPDASAGVGATFSAVSGAAFSLESFEYSSRNLDTLVTGYLAGGGTVSMTIAPTTSGNMLTTIDFDSSWSNLAAVKVFTSGNSFGQIIDNVSVNVVPIPAAGWLFVSALAGLGWLRHRRKV